ncbi:MAG: hypothetical protein JKY49_11705, partial [Cohaesibacteraceae bacterium]|nr:hypothetical protein [Cohaesibacteraceae bacterium]MBL4876496.1 hypothetical protein [Cohaesibacteraceae bacterium]
MRALVEAGNGIGFQTIIGLDEALTEGKIRFVPLIDDELPKNSFSIITHTGRELNLAPEMFFEHAKSVLSKHKLTH